MKAHENKYISFLIMFAVVAAVLILVFVGFKYVLPACVPLIIGFIFSGIIIRPVNFLHKKLKINRSILAGIFTLLIVTLGGFLFYLLIAQLVYQANSLFDNLPEYAEKLGALFLSLVETVETYLQNIPFIGGDGGLNLTELISNIKLPEFSFGSIIGPVGSVASSVPGILISAVFIFVSTYFLTSQRREITGFVKKSIGARLSDIAENVNIIFKDSVFKWLKSQGILMTVTFCILFVGFGVMRLDYFFALAFFIAIIDALPVLGVGTILIPWAAVSIFSQDYRRAIVLCVLYLIILVVRNVLEPKIMGVQLGVHPFAMLLCVYFGYRFGGFLGMFLTPIIVICIIKLRESEYI